jgi:4-hydroxy-3-methylbut-2-enyl diphosphate reductase
MGVRRAVDIAHAEADRLASRSPLPVYTLGSLIHNPQVLEDLESRGVGILDEQLLPEDLQGSSVIIRAHGVSPQTEAELRKRGAAIIDATCPRVKASQLQAASFAKAGYRLFLAGEESHAEIAGIRGYYETSAESRPAQQKELFPSLCVVMGSAAEAEKIAAGLIAEPQQNTALIAQTTMSAEDYQAIGKAILRYFPDLEIVETICAATRERQDSLRELLD